MVPAAGHAGNGQVDPLGHELHGQLRLAAGALDVGRGGGQGEYVLFHDHRLAAAGADIGKKARLLMCHGRSSSFLVRGWGRGGGPSRRKGYYTADFCR